MESSSSSPAPAVGSPINPVFAAGVVLWRASPDGPEFLLLKNRRHGTWSFAKGHLEESESLLAGALREVLEETGIALLETDLVEGFADTSIYRPAALGRYKRVVYFLAATAVHAAALQLSNEHADHCWLNESNAMARLDHQDLKRTVARAALRLAHIASAN